MFLFFFRPDILSYCSSFSFLLLITLFLLSTASFSCSLNLAFFSSSSFFIFLSRFFYLLAFWIILFIYFFFSFIPFPPPLSWPSSFLPFILFLSLSRPSSFLLFLLFLTLYRPSSFLPFFLFHPLSQPSSFLPFRFLHLFIGFLLSFRSFSSTSFSAFFFPSVPFIPSV